MAKKKKNGPSFEEDDDIIEQTIVDVNGNPLSEGDSVIAIKDIKGK
jgi:uncharacterized Zn ribbon protein